MAAPLSATPRSAGAQAARATCSFRMAGATQRRHGLLVPGRLAAGQPPANGGSTSMTAPSASGTASAARAVACSPFTRNEERAST